MQEVHSSSNKATYVLFEKIILEKSEWTIKNGHPRDTGKWFQLNKITCQNIKYYLQFTMYH
jgi:hypothetical protein